VTSTSYLGAPFSARDAGKQKNAAAIANAVQVAALITKLFIVVFLKTGTFIVDEQAEERDRHHNGKRRKRMAKTAFQYQRGNIWIQQDSVAYRNEVVRYLDLIRTTYAGRVLLKFINAIPKGILILPYKPTAADPVNAYAQPQSEPDAYTKGYSVMKGFDIPGFGTIQLPTAVFGTGAGSNVWLKYHPATWRQYILNTGGIAPGSGPGEVLFHEMVHAQRMLEGKFIRTMVLEHIHMDDFEEFCAIVAANIYRSERGFELLRSDHWGNQAIRGPRADQAEYYNVYKAEFERWYGSQPNFCRALAESPAKFNPLRIAVTSQGVGVYTPMALRQGS